MCSLSLSLTRTHTHTHTHTRTHAWGRLLTGPYFFIHCDNDAQKREREGRGSSKSRRGKQKTKNQEDKKTHGIGTAIECGIVTKPLRVQFLSVNQSVRWLVGWSVRNAFVGGQRQDGERLKSCLYTNLFCLMFITVFHTNVNPFHIVRLKEVQDLYVFRPFFALKMGGRPPSSWL